MAEWTDCVLITKLVIGKIVFKFAYSDSFNLIVGFVNFFLYKLCSVKINRSRELLPPYLQFRLRCQRFGSPTSRRGSSRWMLSSC